MGDEIRVSVVSYGAHRALSMVYHDPTTGRKVAKSSGTRDETEAERAAAVWQAELNSGKYVAPSRMTWADFRKRLESQKLAPMPESTRGTYRSCLNVFERVCGPDKLAKVTTALMSDFSAKCRAEGMKPSTLAKNLRHLKTLFRWGERQGLLPKAPYVEMPKQPGGFRGKHRPLSTEEVEKLVIAARKVRPKDAPAWERVIWGASLSGLRLAELVALRWHDDDAPAGFTLDVSGPEPVFHIEGGHQKSGKTEDAPAAPDFGDWVCDQTPEAERVGLVFPLPSAKGGNLRSKEVGFIVRQIGRRAGVVLGEVEKVTRDATGKVTRATVKATPSIHDCRRSFATRWSRKVPAPTLQRLCRHASIDTTLRYYCHLTVGDIAADLRAALGAADGNSPARGNKSGNIGQNRPSEAGRDSDPKALQGKG
jgi:integrase